MDDPEKLIKKLEMLPHPEGGYFSESFRDKDNNVSLIYYLLKKGQRSHWHRLTKNEILHFYKGDSMSVYISEDGKRSYTEVLGNKIINILMLILRELSFLYISRAHDSLQL